MIDNELAKKQIEAAVLNSSILSDLNGAQVTKLARLLREVFEMGFVAATNEMRLIERPESPHGDMLPQGNTLPTGSKKDRTSFVMELGVDDTTVVVTQITLEMLISNMDIKTRAHLLQELAI